MTRDEAEQLVRLVDMTWANQPWKLGERDHWERTFTSFAIEPIEATITAYRQKFRPTIQEFVATHDQRIATASMRAKPIPTFESPTARGKQVARDHIELSRQKLRDLGVRIRVPQ